MSGTADAKSLWFMNCHVAVRLAAAENAGGMSITEHLLPGGFAPPYHVHHDEDETFYILDGAFRMKLDGATSMAKPGDAVHLPRGIPHGFKVVSPEGGRCLIISKGRFEAMLRSASVVAASASLPEQREPTVEMQAALTRICAEHGIELLGPPID